MALSNNFFERDTLVVAEELLGKYLVREEGGEERAYMITEVEAYDGPNDRASHASRGKTSRNAVMFGPAGVWYVYLCYGVHWMLNMVTGPSEYPAAVLIRGVEEAAGPGRVTKLLGVTKRFDGHTASKSVGLWIEDRGVHVHQEAVERGPRIGVAYAGPVWASKPFRFSLKKKAGAPGARRNLRR